MILGERGRLAHPLRSPSQIFAEHIRNIPHTLRTMKTLPNFRAIALAIIAANVTTPPPGLAQDSGDDVRPNTPATSSTTAAAVDNKTLGFSRTTGWRGALNSQGTRLTFRSNS